MPEISSLLVANRGEIACRIMRTARSLGIRTVAIVSDADAGAPHASMADRAVRIGPAPAAQSYLDVPAILAAAQETGADAIHPGYGFLSENPAFAQACLDAGLVFVGPPPSAIAAMGNKAEAKRRMIAAGVPCVPGYEGEDQSDEALTREAGRIGFPVMVKAAAGGGGRGMRLVESEADLHAALASARSEAVNAFGSGELILEKAVLRPRHVEVQVFADSHGATIHLGERDCSVQRRHQKVIEEAPCPVMTPELREAMGRAAVEAARAVGYVGAGTVEFLLDGDGSFYFLEMNTRLQVEHPVTEMVTGIDLVAMQIAVAEGKPLPLAQKDLRLDGHAIEVRLYAEDPANGFLPATGRVLRWRPPAGEGVRVDCGIGEGFEVSPFYDPMIAKLIAHGPTREIARRRLAGALKDTVLFGLPSNKSFLLDALERQAFADGAATTAFIAEEFPEGPGGAAPGASAICMAAAVLHALRRDACRTIAPDVPEALLDWASNGGFATPLRLAHRGESMDVLVRAAGAGRYWVRLGGEEREVVLTHGEPEGSFLAQTQEGRFPINALLAGGRHLHVDIAGRSFVFRETLGEAAAASAGASGGAILAPMHGRVTEIAVRPGDVVAAGDRVLVLEAMKMQHSIAAPIAGTVREVLAAAGSQAASGDLLVVIGEGEDG